MINRLQTRGHSSLRLVKTHRNSKCHILLLISPVVKLQGNLRQHTELSGLFSSCPRYNGTQHMPSLSSKNISEERLTVVVGNAHELKLLTFPAYQPGTH